MKAAFYRGNRSFSVEDVQQSQPDSGEVRIKVAYCGICGTDLHVYQGHMDKRVGFERVIGHEMSGTVEAVGPDVTDFTPGDRVVVRPLRPCGTCAACRAGLSHICHRLDFIGLDSDGAFQERWNVPASLLHRVPENVQLDAAALIEPLAVACHVVDRARVAPGETAVVIGGGPIGMLTALVAREAGARVLVTELSPHRRNIAERLGFTLLPTAEVDIVYAVDEATDGRAADVVFEISGSETGARLMTMVAASRGRIAMVAIHAERRSIDLFRFFWRELEMVGSRVYEPQDYERAIDLVASGRIDPHQLVTDIRDIDEINEAFAALVADPKAMKTLIRLDGGS